jgi:hypothetical protein
LRLLVAEPHARFLIFSERDPVKETHASQKGGKLASSLAGVSRIVLDRLYYGVMYE